MELSLQSKFSAQYKSRMPNNKNDIQSRATSPSSLKIQFKQVMMSQHVLILTHLGQPSTTRKIF